MSDGAVNSNRTGSGERSWPHGPTAFERRFGNMATRILVAVVAIPVFMYAIMQGEGVFLVFIGAISTGALLEFYWLLERGGARPAKLLGVVTGLVLLLVFVPGVAELLVWPIVTTGPLPGAAKVLYAQLALLVGILLLFVGAAASIAVFRKGGNPVADVPGTIVGVFYVSLSLATLVGFHWLFKMEVVLGASVYDGQVNGEALSPVEKAQWLVLMILVGIWACDSVAYFAGKSLGKHKLAPSISPKKTWEGAVAGALFAVLVVFGMQHWFLPYLTPGQAIVIGVIVGVFGQLGDLAESKLKRSAGIKDSSQIIPGHGGLLDRFDSLLWVAPLVFLYIAFFVVPASVR